MAYGIQGQPVPLFDRLIDEAPELAREQTPMRVYGEDGLRQSVARDLTRLLNTRSAGLMPGYPTVLDYGVPDFGHLFAASLTDRTALAESVRAAIVAYEPRLQSPVVTIQADPSNVLQALGLITGKLGLDLLSEPVSFEIFRPESEGDLLVRPVPFRTLTVPPRAGSRSITRG